MNDGIYILTGAIQTGKTTNLVTWSKNRNDVFGILTPAINGKRFFMNVQTRDNFPMEADMEEKETLNIGRFIFSREAFNKAIKIIDDSIDRKGWLIIDEIGPLELKGEGFVDVLKNVLKKRNEKTLLVVREGLIEKITGTFKIVAPTIIHNISDLLPRFK